MLKKTVLTFAFLTILTTFYGFNAQFSAPATDDALNALAEMHHSLLPEGSYVISAYDNLIRNISEEEGHDWLKILFKHIYSQAVIRILLCRLRITLSQHIRRWLNPYLIALNSKFL